jgi:hypothetical protein
LAWDGWLVEYAPGRDLDANAVEGSGGGAGRYILGETLCRIYLRTRYARFLRERRYLMRCGRVLLEMGTTDGPALLA